MERLFSQALATGCERVAAWADLLDDINVYPVADGDTGRNLKISLAPLGGGADPAGSLVQMLVEAATGNSGIIAAAFFSGFLPEAQSATLDTAIDAGRQAAWRAVADPKPGTMLTAFDALAQAPLGPWGGISGQAVEHAIDRLDDGVRATVQLLPELQRAGVVDAGALGMFIFFEGFFGRLTNRLAGMPSVAERFAGLLRRSDKVGDEPFPGYCVNTVLQPLDGRPLVPDMLASEESVVAVPDNDRLRLHLHTHNHRETRNRLAALGKIVDWQVEAMTVETPLPETSANPRSVHVMTDAAGSLTRADARTLGVSLLDSHLIVNDRRVPETLFDAQTLYETMADGRRVSTAQASLFQKHQSYQQVLGRYDRVLYLCVGSVYTGNYATACRWRDASGHADRFTVIDTGAASGRLGLIVRLVAEAARTGGRAGELVALTQDAMASCDELVFLDQLKFLAAGGRISKSKGFFGDLLGIRPVIRPAAEGAVKAGTVRKAEEQVPFAVRHLQQRYAPDARLRLLLQFSDNEKRVRDVIRPEIQRRFPQARIEISRLSLTSGAHMGPGTWGVAFSGEL